MRDATFMRSWMIGAFVLQCLLCCKWAAAEEKSAGEDQVILWQIGQKDGKPDEFALAPSRFGEFREDPLFVIGTSDAQKEWPYVQPGPADVWAGSKPHSATVVFGLAAPPEKACELVIALVNTHGQVPPRVQITINGQMVLDRALPRGGPDATIMGDLAQAKPHEIRVGIPPEHLRGGANTLTITTREGSWMIYDAVLFLAPSTLKPASLTDFTAVRTCRAVPALVKVDGELMQVIEMEVLRAGAAALAEVTCDQEVCWSGQLGEKLNEILVPIKRVGEARELKVQLRIGQNTIFEKSVAVQPVREWVVYLLPHSHVDIGFTQLQTKVEQDHWQFYEQAVETAKKTANYPQEARFKWNVEVLWAVDSYLRQATPEKREEFIAAIKSGVIGLQALYGNELTALCRPEELLRLVDYAQRLRQQLGVEIDSAMISDVPGYTWGIVTALAKGGVRYFSIGPNGGHRIGHTLRVWGDKAFWWISPSGQERVLCWIPRRGYWRGFRGKEELFDYLAMLQKEGYPFTLVQIRHCLGDNAAPDLAISDFVKEWNARYAYPRLVIATCSEMMHEFEKRYGAELPAVSGDFTPYWEDGAASSALETGLVRRAADRLSVAETFWAMLRPANYPDEAFYQAWRNVLLYDEHTWGAFNSISEPDSEFARAQWAIKQRFALQADEQSRALLQQSVASVTSDQKPGQTTVLVLNPCGWTRTDLVEIPNPPANLQKISDSQGQPVPWQKLHDGRVLFLATDVPGFGGRSFTIEAGPGQGEAPQPGSPSARSDAGSGLTLGDTRYEMSIDEHSGAIIRLVDRQLGRDLVDKSQGWGLGEYLYVPGRSPEKVQRVAGPARVRLLDQGPLLWRCEVETSAPGCRGIKRLYELGHPAGRIRMELILDKEPVRTPEGVHVAFPFAVPEGQMRMELSWAIIRPEMDQLPGACKNYFTVQRWIDISNEQFGVLWGSWEAPLVELGTIRTDVPTPFQPEGWLTNLDPTQTILSYVMNNYWETNYKADQEGPTPFTYFIMAHRGGYDPVTAMRFGMETTRPLVAITAGESCPPEIPCLLSVVEGTILPMECKTSRDGKAVILRLYNPTGQPLASAVKLSEKLGQAKVWITDLSEQPLSAVEGSVTVPALGLVCLRIEP